MFSGIQKKDAAWAYINFMFIELSLKKIQTLYDVM